jgi:hypothetical protein
MEMKKYIKSDPLLFKLWYHLYRKNRGVPIKFFSNQTELYFDGYPRSGNTYLLHLISNLWPDLNVVHHFHAVAPIKISLKRNIPVFILLRDPLNAITSWYLKELSMNDRRFDETNINLSLLEKLAKDYLDYYQWVEQNEGSVTLIHFNQLILRPDLIMLAVNDLLEGQKKLSNEVLLSKVEAIRNESFGAKDKLGASLPTREKEKAKNILKDKLENKNIFEKCKKVFNGLQQKD